MGSAFHVAFFERFYLPHDPLIPSAFPFFVTSLLYFLYMHRGSDLVDSLLQFRYAILHQKLTLHGALFCSIQRRVSYFLRHGRLIPIFSPFLFSSVIMLDVFHRYLPFPSFLCCNALCGEGFAILFSFIMPIFNLTNLDHFDPRWRDFSSPVVFVWGFLIPRSMKVTGPVFV
ncbi:hypothetical protein BDV23DRAFT_139396 [Aspergillus alliaceus]|uniref:Uncharacterized protein n=1 Tax=Petromyces alliaceus TaxID=209559 RepID=A0A5N7BXN2_PETAA|nr:hypothetical protein BDV23DRAFT_139396 [Aspergillus alliaceus]